MFLGISYRDWMDLLRELIKWIFIPVAMTAAAWLFWMDWTRGDRDD